VVRWRIVRPTDPVLSDTQQAEIAEAAPALSSFEADHFPQEIATISA
jgi:hypothetical protein